MSINILGALGSVSGVAYSRKMATRAQENFQSQLDLKREIEKGKLDISNRQLEELTRHNKMLEAIEEEKSKASKKEANAELRKIRLEEKKFKASLASNTNSMKEGEK